MERESEEKKRERNRGEESQLDNSAPNPTALFLARLSCERVQQVLKHAHAQKGDPLRGRKVEKFARQSLAA